MSPIKNVIFIMLDTLQFNYLGCYGNTRVKTPNIDRFATERQNAQSGSFCQTRVPVRERL